MINNEFVAKMFLARTRVFFFVYMFEERLSMKSRDLEMSEVSWA